MAGCRGRGHTLVCLIVFDRVAVNVNFWTPSRLVHWYGLETSCVKNSEFVFELPDVKAADVVFEGRIWTLEE